MKRANMGSLAMFVAVADEGSFTRAAARLGVSQSALSHSLRRLEASMGMRLLTRTTRSVAPTDAGERLLETLRPAFDDIDERIAALTALRERPAGNVRLSASVHAAHSLLWPVVDRIVAENPDISFEISVDSALTDIVSGKFDAGVRLGESVEKDMIAVRISPQMRMAACASPEYIAKHGVPQTPRDLGDHNCINLRFVSSGGLYAWEFEKEGEEIRTKVEGQITTNDPELIVKAALAGHGVGFLLDDHLQKYFDEGSLVRVLGDWCEPFDGYYIYYPSRRQPSPAFTLLLNALRASAGPR